MAITGSMGVIYSAGMAKNVFDVAPGHGRTPFIVDEPHEGENIDSLNDKYNEITCLYYAWKHHGDTDYVGLEHYRRAIWNTANTHLLEPEEITKILQEYDIILTDNYVFFPDTMDHYCLPFDYCTHHIERMNELYDGFGDFYMNFMRTHYAAEFSWTNMFIARTSVADEYCKFLFDLCFSIKAPTGTKRFYGYACEKLLSPWAAFRNLKTYRGRIHVYSPKPAYAGY